MLAFFEQNNNEIFAGLGWVMAVVGSITLLAMVIGRYFFKDFFK